LKRVQRPTVNLAMGVRRSSASRIRAMTRFANTAGTSVLSHPWGVNKGPKLRAGFLATTEINRHDFGVPWNDKIDRGGVVVGDTVYITIDAEAIVKDD